MRARARQSGVELPLVISDHADWPDLQRTIRETGAREFGSRTARRTPSCIGRAATGLAAKPLHMVGYGDEEERGGMNRFAELLDRLAYEPRAQRQDPAAATYFRETPDPDRGCALAAITGALSFRNAKPGLMRGADRGAHGPGAVRSVLRLCRRPLRDGGADVAGAAGHRTTRRRLTEVVEALHAYLQERAAGPRRAPSRCPRRDRALGAPQADHRRAPHRRLGPARQDGRRGARRPHGGRGRARLAGPPAAL